MLMRSDRRPYGNFATGQVQARNLLFAPPKWNLTFPITMTIAIGDKSRRNAPRS
jgi:hypothetical protein